MFEFSYVAISLTGILLWVLHGLHLSCHLCLVFEVMVYLTCLDAEIGLLELYGMLGCIVSTVSAGLPDFICGLVFVHNLLNTC